MWHPRIWTFIEEEMLSDDDGMFVQLSQEINQFWDHENINSKN